MKNLLHLLRGRVSLPDSIPFQCGDVRGEILTFDKAGDRLPMHTHGVADSHFTIISRGEFLCRGPAFKEMHLVAGAQLDFEPGDFHEFEALTPGARLHQIQRKTR